MTYYDLFISYAHGENNIYIPYANYIYNVLNDNKIRCWIDLYNAKKTSKVIFYNAIKLSKTILVLLTQEYINSYYCNYELLTAITLNKPLLIIAFEPLILSWHPVFRHKLSHLFTKSMIDKYYKTFNNKSIQYALPFIVHKIQHD